MFGKKTKTAPKAQKPKSTVRGQKKIKVASTQRYLDFAGAHDDMLVLKNGGLRTILEVGSVNFNLKSEPEQESIILSYQRFLNALNFPIQILIKSRKLDIDVYLEGLKEKMRYQQNELLKNQMGEYIEYVSKLVEYADIMEKKFYVVIPYDPPRAEKKSTLASFMSKIKPDDKITDIIQRRREFKELKRGLDERIDTVVTGLQNCGLEVKQLDTQKIIELYYQCYNPQLARSQKFGQIGDIPLEPNPEEQLVTS